MESLRAPGIFSRAPEIASRQFVVALSPMGVLERGFAIALLGEAEHELLVEIQADADGGQADALLVVLGADGEEIHIQSICGKELSDHPATPANPPKCK